MQFTDEQKAKEFEAFAAYYSLVSKRPLTAGTRSRLNQLDSIAKGDYGNGPFQELRRANRVISEQKKEITLGKQAGGGLSRDRRNQPPEQQPKKMTADRAARQALREAQGVRSAAPAVVAVANLVEAAKPEKAVKLPKVAEPPELKQIELTTGATFDVETGATERDLTGDARELSAKELVERYGRDPIFEALFNAGFERESLEQKTDRQLANTLKKHVTE